MQFTVLIQNSKVVLTSQTPVHGFERRRAGGALAAGTNLPELPKRAEPNFHIILFIF